MYLIPVVIVSNVTFSPHLPDLWALTDYFVLYLIAQIKVIITIIVIEARVRGVRREGEAQVGMGENGGKAGCRLRLRVKRCCKKGPSCPSPLPGRETSHP